MRRIIILLFLHFLFIGQNINAQTITVFDAIAKAEALRSIKHHKVKALSSSFVKELAYTETNSVTPLFYVFNYSDGGFAIIGADERAKEILGYCDSGEFNIDSIPDGLKYMLGSYSEQIDYAIKNDMIPSTSLVRNSSSAKSSISPLLSTRWNQNGSWPSYLNAYNGQLPKITESAVPLATGCVATALAQIMKFYNYPTRGQGSPKSYDNLKQWNGAPTLTVYADFANTTYDWANMLDEYPGTYKGTQSEIAVGTLMYHVGVAVDMIYGQCTSGGSGAYDRNVGSGMATHFGYNNATLQNRDSYTDSEWENLVYDELIQNHPIYYSGSEPNSTSGHAFVCDGYDSVNDNYHFNWGWGGYCDGYYPITGIGALQPNGSGTGGSGNDAAYTQGQKIYVGLYPATTAILVTGISLNSTSAPMTVGDTKSLTATITPANAANKNVLWSSSNTSVATVSTSGVVTAKAVGAATITCTAADGSGKSATCYVTVTSSSNLLDRSEVVTTNTAGATVSFSTTDTYEWEWDSANSRMMSTNYNVNSSTSQTTINISTTKSTDLSFAYAISSESRYDKLTITLDETTIVDAISGTTSGTYNGTLTSGSHILILKYSKDSSSKSGDDRAYFSNLQLKLSTVLVTGISLNSPSASLTVGDTKSLTATITPTNATNKNVTWSSNNTSVATVGTSGVVTAKAAGTAIISCTAVDGSGKSATCSITVTPTIIDGDANGDRDVDVSDVALAVEYILGHNPSGFVVAAADLDHDGVIDVADVTLMINIIMYGNPLGLSFSNHAKVTTSGDTSYLYIAPDSHNLSLWLQNTDNTLSAMQFDLLLPKGVELTDVMPSSFMSEHFVSSSLLENGMIRVLCISLSNSQLSPDSHGVMTIVLSKPVDRLDYIGLHNIVATTPNGEKMQLNDISWTDATSINNATGEPLPKHIYSVNGQKHKMLHKGVNVIETSNGSYKKVIIMK